MEETTLTARGRPNDESVYFHLDLSQYEVSHMYKTVFISAHDLKNVTSISFRFCFNTTETGWKPGESFDSADYIRELPQVCCQAHKYNVGLKFTLRAKCDTVQSYTSTVDSEPCRQMGCEYCQHDADDCLTCMDYHDDGCLGNNTCKYAKRGSLPCVGTRPFEVTDYKWDILYTGTRYEGLITPGPGVLKYPLVRLGDDSYNVIVSLAKSWVPRYCRYPLFVKDWEDNDPIPLEKIKPYLQTDTLEEQVEYFNSRKRWSTNTSETERVS